MMSPFSGPKGSPFDAKVAVFYDNLPGGNAWTAPVADTANLSTGGLSTGIGFGLNAFDGFADKQPGRALHPNADYKYIAGTSTPSGTEATTAIYTCIGGGKMVVTLPDETPVVTPYVAQPLLGFGGGGSRDADAGAGPAFTGFATKAVTATGAVAVGAAVEAGWTNRTSYALESGKTVYGSATAASPAVT
jgi:hypothetical protein